jgi:hypothetical protein
LSDQTQTEGKPQDPIAQVPAAATAPKPEATSKHVAAQPPRQLDKLAERRLAAKKQKRKAHRHKINASNTPG